MIAQNVTLSNKQEGKIQKWTKILILVSANRPFRNWLQLATVPERPISINPICNLYLPFYALLRVTFCQLSSLNFEVKTQQYFVNSSDMFLEKNTLLKIWLNPGLNLQCNHFRGFIPRL